MPDRAVQQITVTNDVHSALGNAARTLGHLHRIRAYSLIADSGDFFEGDGYYSVGGGTLETEALLRLYDVVVPGNHGYARYAKGPLHRLAVCANVRDRRGWVFARLMVRIVAGRRVAITGVLGEQAFTAVPASERSQHRISPPRDVLLGLYREYRWAVDAWVVLSHSGWSADLELAAACPHVDVIFSGHCHSENYGPARVGEVLIAKGGERGRGFASAGPGRSAKTWTLAVDSFPVVDALPRCSSPLQNLLTRIEACTSELAQPVGTLDRAFQDWYADRGELLALVAQRVTELRIGADAVLLNETCLRPAGLRTMLTRGDLLQLAPFNSELMRVVLPRRIALSLRTRLEEMVGRLVLTAIPPGRSQVSVVTTDYIVENALSAGAVPCGISITDVLRDVLTGAPA